MGSSEDSKIEVFRRTIITWYRQHGDSYLPWRRAGDPWCVLIASLLLRKTTTKQVAEVYDKFIKTFPSPESLARAREEDVEELIRPLGMERERAKLLVRLARELVEKYRGRVPCEERELKQLPGVGDYASAEVLLVACNKPKPLLDRNMIRILERVFGVKSSKKRPHTDPALWKFAESLVPPDPEEAKEFNFGVLDFARKICRARNPLCNKCPLKGICLYYASKHTGRRESFEKHHR